MKISDLKIGRHTKDNKCFVAVSIGDTTALVDLDQSDRFIAAFIACRDDQRKLQEELSSVMGNLFGGQG